MTPLEHQVISLELAKQLKELGVPQDSLFWWKYIEVNLRPEWTLVSEKPKDYGEEYLFSAFTVAELGSLIAEKTKSYRWITTFHPRGNREVVRISDSYAARWKGEGETEADARAKMLIYLLKNGLIKL